MHTYTAYCGLWFKGNQSKCLITLVYFSITNAIAVLQYYILQQQAVIFRLTLSCDAFIGISFLVSPLSKCSLSSKQPSLDFK